MRTKISTLFLAIVLLASNLQGASVIVGPTGAYPSINMAIAGQNALGPITEPFLIELQQAYNRPDTIVAVNGASATNTVTIRPEATAISINVIVAGTASDSVVWLMNGCKYVTIDGRAGGVGSAIMTITADTLVGTSTSTRLKKTTALKLINDASYNTIQYVNFRSAVTLGYWRIGSTSPIFKGTIEFGEGITTGNSYNTVDHCDLGPVHSYSGTPSTAIFSKGLLAAPNTNLTISNNNIYDYFATDLNKASGAGIQVGSGVGVLLGANTSACTVSGNSFYQTVQRLIYGNANGAKTGAIIIDNATNGEGFIVKDNYIGGSEPLCGGVNRYHNYIGNNTGFNGIYLSTPAAATAKSYIYGNTIKNIYLFASSAIAQVYKSAGISINGGYVGVGVKADDTAAGNIIGDMSATSVGTTNAAIIFTGSNSNASFAGITFNSLAGANVKIANNKIGGICFNSYATARTASFIGVDIIGTAQSTLVVDNNEIGNNDTGVAPTSMSIQNYQGRNCFGIYMNSSGAFNSTLTISNNKINNMYKSLETSNTQTYVNGIWINTAVLCPITITGNVIRDLAFTSGRVNDTPINWSSGITFGSQGGGSVISNNTISNIEGVGGTSTSVMGIALISTASTANITVKSNDIYNLSSNITRKLTANSIGCTGIYTGTSGSLTPIFNVFNNMIRLGYDRSGTALTSICTLVGVRDSMISSGSAATVNYYNNTIYIGGSNVVASDSISSFGMCLAAATSATRNVKNNLLINARSNTSVATAKRFNVIGSTNVAGTGHYAIGTGGGASVLTNYNSNNNDYVAYGTGGVLGRFTSGAEATDLASIQSYTGGDLLSIESLSPIFIDATGATPNLHLNQTDYNFNEDLNVAATLDAPYNVDFDGVERKPANRTIGADEYFGAVTSVVAPENSSVFVAMANGEIIVKNVKAGQSIAVYSLNGQLVKRLIANGAQTSLKLHDGIYLVKTSQKVIKVVI
ncbi:MAG TPA: hypothetical protein P5084_03650 [Paludibacter sp.]|nr:hypothetical protein [Paludibacter sp.]